MSNLIAMGGPPTPGWEWMILAFFVFGLLVLLGFFLLCEWFKKPSIPDMPDVEYRPEASDDIWAVRCNCCGCLRKTEDRWIDEHICCGAGLNFSFCHECEKNPKACDKVIGRAIKKYLDGRKIKCKKI